jgi:tRNA wybutosine-synthesizing protein 3
MLFLIVLLKMKLDVYEKNFDRHRLEQSLEHCIDLSRKSSVDAYIRELISLLNNLENYFTTSSCSGRFIAFSRDENNAKKNCKWIYVSHDKMTEENIQELVKF